MTQKRKAEGAPKRERKPKNQDAVALARTAPFAPPEPSDAEIAEALGRLETSESLTPEEADIEEVIESLHSPMIVEDDGDDFPLDDEIGEPEDERDDERDDVPEEAIQHLVIGTNGDHSPVNAPRLVAPPSTLLAHCGTSKITREELAGIPTPEGTRTHQPISHISIVEALVETLAFRHIHVVREEYAVSPDGGRMFGVLDLDYQYATLDTFRFSIGVRNANDKTMRLGLTIGYRVFVCDNMMFKGDFTPVLAKHSRKLDLIETLAIGVDRMQRGFEPLRQQVTGWQSKELSDDAAKLVIYEAFLDNALPLPRHLLPIVHKHYFKPEYEAFNPRTLWSLSNAFTSAFKELKPVRQFQATAKLGGFIARKAETLTDMQVMSFVQDEVMRVAHA